jgi:hypothetical protein
VVWNRQILNQRVESQLFTFCEMQTTYPQWFPDIEFNQKSALPDTYFKIWPVWLLEGEWGIWNCHASRGHQKTIIFTSLVYGPEFISTLEVGIVILILNNHLFDHEGHPLQLLQRRGTRGTGRRHSCRRSTSKETATPLMDATIPGTCTSLRFRDKFHITKVCKNIYPAVPCFQESPEFLDPLSSIRQNSEICQGRT